MWQERSHGGLQTANLQTPRRAGAGVDRRQIHTTEVIPGGDKGSGGEMEEGGRGGSVVKVDSEVTS